MFVTYIHTDIHTYIQTLWLLESLDLLDRETKNSAFCPKKVRNFSFNSGVYLMCELDASNKTERSNKIETLVDRLLNGLYGLP